LRRKEKGNQSFQKKSTKGDSLEAQNTGWAY